MTHLSRAIEAGARALCIAAGDDPDQLTYAHEMKCTGCNREPMHRWRYWTTFSEAVITAYEAHLKAEGLVLVDAYERKGRTVREHQENVRALVSVCERALIERNEEILRLRAMIAASQEPSNASD